MDRDTNGIVIPVCKKNGGSPFSGERAENAPDKCPPQLCPHGTGSTGGGRPEDIANVLLG